MKDEEIQDADRRHIWHPYAQERLLHERRPPLVVRRAEGPWLYDDAGKGYLDGSASWWVNLFGHRHPRLLAALQTQLGALPHTALAGLTHEAAARAARALIEVAPTGLDRVFFSDNGSTAVEVALRMAFEYHRNLGRPERTLFLTLEGAFHGETLGAASLSDQPAFHGRLGPLLFQTRHLPSPALQGTEAAWEAAAAILREEAPRCCAVIVEPLIQGAGGMLIYEPEYLRRLRQLTRELGVLLIADEVFTGLGRTGTFWAVEQAGIAPDLLCASKGLGGGLLPFAATLASGAIYAAFYGEKEKAFHYGHSFTANPLGCAVAAEAIALARAALPSLPARIRHFRDGLDRFRELPRVKSVRSLGLIGAVELDGGGYFADSGWEVYDRALARGLYARPLGHVLYLLPMLNLEDELITEMVSRLYLSARETLA